MWAAEHSQLEHGKIVLFSEYRDLKLNWIEIIFIFVLSLYSSEIFKYNWAILKLDHWIFFLGCEKTDLKIDENFKISSFKVDFYHFHQKSKFQNTFFMLQC
jgi:hypothetical protein